MFEPGLEPLRRTSRIINPFCAHQARSLTFLPHFHLSPSLISGYNILNAILDVSGGSLSILQMFIKCYVHPLKDGSPDWTFLTGNAPKTLLAVESIFFNLVFLTQHFILYRHNNRLILRQEELRLNSEALLSDPDISPQHNPFVNSEYSDRSVN
jgi:hypothetical protein